MPTLIRTLTRRRGTALAAAALVLATAACGSGSKQVDPATLQPAQPVGPFAGAANQPAAETNRLLAADNMLTSQCMQGRSFSYHVADPPTPIDAAVTTGVYGLSAAPAAAAEGYGIADNVRIQKAADAIGTAADPQAENTDYVAALRGTDQHKATVKLIGGSDVDYNTDGCVSIALTELYGADWNQVSFDVEGLSAQVVQKVEASPGWRTAMGQWAACMKGEYKVTYATPQAARDDVSSTAEAAFKNVSDAEVSQRLTNVRIGEVRLATEDATCEAKVGLAAAVSAAQDQAQAAYQQQYAGELQAYAADLKHAQGVADSLLGTTAAS